LLVFRRVLFGNQPTGFAIKTPQASQRSSTAFAVSFGCRA